MNNTNKIKCPKCGEEFDITNSEYNTLLNSISEQEINKRVNDQTKLIENNLQSKYDLKIVTNKNDYIQQINKLRIEISDLNNKLKNNEIDNKLKNSEEIQKYKDQINDLKNQILSKTDSWKELEKKYKEDIEQYKDWRTKQNNKLIGELLEQHCFNEFNKYKPFMFPMATFVKDNVPSDETNSKGDFIFRNYTNDGFEFISIMFEMKNQQQTTKTKRHNEDFYKELDKDRNEKKCEYAILVSELETENELFNTGIVDASYSGYKKMYIIRPQYFITIISLLNNIAQKTIEYKRQIIEYKNQHIDITNFEDKLKDYQNEVARHVSKGVSKFDEAIKQIDKTINNLKKIKDDLLTVSRDKLLSANDKLQSITIRKLTYNNPTMQQKFNDLKKSKNKQ